MLRAVIFDMDGVLIDSEPVHAKAAVETLKPYGVELTLDYCYEFIGTSTRFMLQTVIEQYNLSVSCTELETAYQQEKQKLIDREGFSTIPGVIPLIQDLYKHGVQLAIASSSTQSEIENTVRELGIAKYFDKLVSGTTVPNPKPSPDIFFKVLKELGTNASECLIIEDSSNGLSAADAAGIPAIGFVNPHSGKQDLSKASMLIEGFEEINYDFLLLQYRRAHNEPITIIKTKRLIIRELTVDDVKNMYAIYQNPEVKQYIDDIDDYLDVEIEKQKAYIKNVYAFYGYGLWAVFSKDSGRLIGRCGIQKSIIDKKEEYELSYLLDVDHWGCGYATECVGGVLKFCFEKLHLPRVAAVIDRLNERSIQVAKRNRMHREREIWHKNRDCYLYAIEKNEYFSK